MTDVTNLFKAITKTMRLTDTTINRNKSILNLTKNKSEFSCSAKEVVLSITKLRDYLIENRKNYLESVSIFGIRQSKTSDLDMDQIDTEAETFMKTCRQAIKQLSAHIKSQQVPPQNKELNDNILMIIEHYLIEVCKMYSEQKSVRVNRLIERKRISRLEPDSFLLKKYPNLLKASTEKITDDSPSPQTCQQTSTADVSIKNVPREPTAFKTRSSENFQESNEEINQLNSEEKVMLQLENERMYNEMSGMVNELKQIEGKIVEISKLQEIFTENILQQEKDIYKVSDQLVGTTENVKDANDEIREAMKNKAGILVWILFFLIVNTISLLFLDWYND